MHGNTTNPVVAKLQDKAYRDAFVGAQIDMGLPFQIRALREQRGWTQAQLAERAGMKQPRISAVERPGEGNLNIETLRRLAAAFDVGLVVRFAPFDELIHWSETFTPDSFSIPSFEDAGKSKPSGGRFDIEALPNSVPTPCASTEAVMFDAGKYASWTETTRRLRHEGEVIKTALDRLVSLSVQNSPLGTRPQ